jgi:hypothetical protein
MVQFMGEHAGRAFDCSISEKKNATALHNMQLLKKKIQDDFVI